MKEAYLAKNETVQVHSQSIVGFGRTMFLRRRPTNADIVFLRAVYNAGRECQARVVRAKYNEFIKTFCIRHNAELPEKEGSHETA